MGVELALRLVLPRLGEIFFSLRAAEGGAIVLRLHRLLRALLLLAKFVEIDDVAQRSSPSIRSFCGRHQVTQLSPHRCFPYRARLERLQWWAQALPPFCETAASAALCP